MAPSADLRRLVALARSLRTEIGRIWPRGGCRGGSYRRHAGTSNGSTAPSWEEPQLHYRAREKRGSSAEVDQLISQGSEIIPVEVKAGKTGSLKSLHLLLRERGRSLSSPGISPAPVPYF